jgi:hypothetical protein
VTDLGDWLDQRRPAPPEPLRRAIDRIITAAGPAPGAIHDRLADVALGELRRVAGEPSRRSGAGRLLAVDALLTYACEAAAEGGPVALAELAERLDWTRFEALLEAVAA